MDSKKFLEMAKEFWGKHRVWIIPVLIISIAVYSYFAFKPDGYQTLYSNLSDQDKQDILTELSKKGIDYKLDDTTKSISVKKENVSWVRQEMNSLGLPANTSATQGYNLFTQSSLGSTSQDAAQRELKARKEQLQMELPRSFPFIDQATVNLTMPEDTSIFENTDKKGGSASVTIRFKTGTKVTQQQILGIQNMVSSAIPGVTPEDVKVIDSIKGIISGAALQEDTASTSYEKQMEIEQKAEENIKQDIKSSLSSLFGYDNVQLNVNMVINFDEIVQNIETYGNGVLRSQHKDNEDTTKIDDTNGDVAGIDSNGQVVGYNANAATNAKVVYQQKKEDIINNFEVDKTVQTIKKNPQLTNTNVVFWVNQSALKKKKINATTFRQAIGVAAGLKYNAATDTFDNGQVSVMILGFQPAPKATTSAKPTESKETGLSAILAKYSLYIVIGIAVLLVLVVLFFVLLIRKKKKRKEEELKMEQVQEMVRQQQREETYQRYEELEEEELEDAVDEKEQKLRDKKEKKRKQLNEQVEQLSSEYTKETADYVRKLLKERK